jgi:glutathione peroxidase
MADATRRLVLAALAGGASMTFASAETARAWDFSFPAIDGGTLNLSDLRGKVLLVTNTASFCGYTYQYEALQRLHEARAGEGLVVIGVPSQDFNQESPDNATVKTFCDTRFGISFPLAGLTHVRGKDAAPFYAWVKTTTGWQPAWNFNKVLIGRDGLVLGTFGSGEEPDGTTVSQAISVALGKSAATG